METALTLAIGGVVLLFLAVVTTLVLLGRRVRRGRKLGRYPYRAKPNGTYDNSTHNGMS